MILQIIFAIYIFIITTLLFYLGINLLRIRDKTNTHPKIICFMLPFLANFITAKTIFYDIHPLYSTLLPAILFYLMTIRLEKVRIFGVTGGIACGKSTLIRLIKDSLIVDIIDCDEISRKLSQKGGRGYKLILKLLGDESVNYVNPKNKEIYRDKFSKFVFENPDFRKKLTREMGKHIMWEIFKSIIVNIFQKKYMMVIDAPILYETKILEHVCYPIIVVGCSEQSQMERLEKRNGYSKEEAQNRIQSQMPLSEKKQKCQIYLENEGIENQLLASFLKKVTKYLDKRETLTFRNAPL